MGNPNTSWVSRCGADTTRTASGCYRLLPGWPWGLESGHLPTRTEMGLLPSPAVPRVSAPTVLPASGMATLQEKSCFLWPRVARSLLCRLGFLSNKSRAMPPPCHDGWVTLVPRKDKHILFLVVSLCPHPGQRWASQLLSLSYQRTDFLCNYSKAAV